MVADRMSRQWTMSTVQRQATVAALRQYSAKARARAEQVVVNSAERMVNLIAGLCPYDKAQLDDFHMIDHIRVRIAPGGLGYEAGFFHDDFAEAGQDDYFIYTEFGTTKMAAQPCVFPARDTEQPRFEAELALAIQPRPGDLM
jgi:hypothetical protein